MSKKLAYSGVLARCPYRVHNPKEVTTATMVTTIDTFSVA